MARKKTVKVKAEEQKLGDATDRKEVKEVKEVPTRYVDKKTGAHFNYFDLHERIYQMKI